ncbi:hypothetical protein QBC47DRAFT_411648 [Echria macrotheca]|uniref:LIM zinc-binding domain-containing protein n=1 Tax=Echria macrotheca TaxID=438768 RepID=A0AAJ0BI13_9PEZI|nr:hypothetical protein QBC47DRAFT_411648 [Echria macrotheca]
MFTRSKSKEPSSTRKVTPPSPSYMTNEQFAAYLAELRNTRINRPGGARPQPAPRRDAAGLPVSARSSLGSPTQSETASVNHHRAQSDASNAPVSSARPSMTSSVSSRYSTMTQGRDYYPDRPVQPLKPSEVVPSATYIERGQRWMEKEEAFSLRQAMEDMDLKEKPGKRNVPIVDEQDPDDKRIYDAALNEAAELVWKHQHPTKDPEPGAPYRYRPHLRKNSYAHARTASAGIYGADVAPTGLARDPSMRSVSGSSTDSDGAASTRGRPSFASSRQASGTKEAGRGSLDSQPSMPSGPRSAKPYGSISGRPSATQGGRRRSSLKRDISGEVQKPFSGDQIWEEPDSSAPRRPEATDADASVQPLQTKPKNPLNRVQFAPEVPGTPDTPPAAPPKVVSRFEIHRNPVTQTRNPQYTTNNGTQVAGPRDNVPRKHGMEIRSDDIRQATSMRLKDRSSKLPTPSAVSDNPGRPIVSFDRSWRPPEEATDTAPEESGFGRGGRQSTPTIPNRVNGQHPQQSQQQAQEIPVISITKDAPTPAASTAAPRQRALPTPATGSVNGPPVPSIAVSDAPSPIPTIAVSDSSSSIPTIVLPGDADHGPGIPVIVTPEQGDTKRESRPLPTPRAGAPRVRQAARPHSHWSPDPRPIGSRATARCHECGHFIEGRFVSLAGSNERFHPQCFSCYSCGTSLEALEISPEPDAHRAARLDRIARREAGEILPEEPGQTMAEDGDTRLRFYCHLDWHELFAPRCKHCKTPIMGEHVVALGAHWHFGHFFCAECGDPFERGMTHIEKDGYAWCVSCQTKRTERRAPKCRKCRKAVIGQYVQALGGEWHDECFRCATCNGGFDDGQIFPMDGRGAPGETVVLCTGCMEKELKA